MNILKAELIDPASEAELNKSGFIKFDQLFSEGEVRQMLDLYDKSHTDKTNNQIVLWNSLYEMPPGKGLELSQQLLTIVQPRLASIITNYKAPVAMLMSKNFGNHSDCGLHRDTSAFDESKFEYFNIWIPLVDTDETNGSVYFLRGSNHFFDYPRPPALLWHYEYLTDKLMPRAETIKAKAGDCVVFLGKVLHGSRPNLSDKFRPVVFVGAIHPQAELLFYFYDEKTKEVRAYAVPDDFYFGKDFSEPVGKYPQRLSFKFDPPYMDPEEISEKLKNFAESI